MKNLMALSQAGERAEEIQARLRACFPWPRLLPLLLLTCSSVTGAQSELKDLAVSGGIENGKARITIEGILTGLMGEQQKPVFETAVQETINVGVSRINSKAVATFDILAGNPNELPLTITGEGEIRQVTGDLLQDWGIRQETNGTRTLVLRPRKSEKPPGQLSVTITADHELKDVPAQWQPLTLTPPQPALFNGYIKIDFAPELSVQAQNPSGLAPLEPKFLPESMRPAKPDESAALAFRFQGTAYSLPLSIALADPDARRVVLRDFRLEGQVADKTAAFTLKTVASIKDPNAGSLDLLSGAVALTGVQEHNDWRVRFENGKFVFSADKAGVFPIELKFNAKVEPSAEGPRGWSKVDFRVAPAALEPLVLKGLAEQTQFEFPGAARPERAGDQFTTYLPSDGSVRLSWKESRPESEGKLFYAAEMLSQISVGPGLMRQVAVLDFKVMQGELSRVVLLLHGAGEVTRVQGKDVLAWNVEPVSNSPDRRLLVQFNQPQKDLFSVQVQLQTELGAFPVAAEAVQLRAEGATRFAGYFRIVNEGAVRLEVSQASGLSQISPEKFPETDVTKAVLRPTGAQKFAYRFSGGDFALRIQADQILPEIAVSEVAAYRVGETELSIDAELELDIREAPLRELLLEVPKRFAVARLTANGMSDYFVRDLEGESEAELRVVFGQPVSGRQLVQLRLERNQALSEPAWTLPRIALVKAKSVRGHIAVSADTGFRLTPEGTQGLTEIATAFFPRKVAGIQGAFRLSDPNWQATVRVERLPQTVQLDAFHLFSIGEGIAYGSSVLNFTISGAPVSTFKIQLSDEYFNVEFTGKDVRNWQKTTNGFEVHLHSPVSGAYTLLATYERPFKAQGETLTFTGARPLDTQSDQGHTVIISAYQFQVKPVEISAGLMPLETREVPAEYRLFFDAPLLAAYRYNSRPFNLALALTPLAQGDSLSQVVDRASLTTRISKEGQVLTEGRYFIKNRGNPHLRLELPPDTRLWSSTINGAAVVPVLDKKANLIPLPQTSDANAILRLELKLAAKSANPKRVHISAPLLGAPVMLAEWQIEPDVGQRLVYRGGSLTPAAGVRDNSGFAQVVAVLSGPGSKHASSLFAGAVLFVAAAIVFWRWGSSSTVYRFGARHLAGTTLGLLAIIIAVFFFVNLAQLAQQKQAMLSRNVILLAPVQQAGGALSVDVSNVSDRTSIFTVFNYVWPLLVAAGVWLYGWLAEDKPTRTVAWLCGWTVLAWAALRLPNGVSAFVAVIVIFLVVQAVIPALRHAWRVPAPPAPLPPAPATSSAASAAALWLLCGLAWLAFAATPEASAAARTRSKRELAPPTTRESGVRTSPASLKPLAESVLQTMRVDDKYVTATAKVRWQAQKGQLLPLIFEPAVLTGISYPTNSLKLVQATGRAHELLALATGTYEVELQYQLQVIKKDSENGVALPLQHGLVNELNVTLVNLDVELVSPEAISIEASRSGSNTLAKVLLPPANGAWVGWKPRSRDVKHEKAVFYAELSQLYVPAAGVVEGGHFITIRPAQGEVAELTLNIPAGAMVTDVADGMKSADANTKAPALVSLWRFDPDTRKLRVTLGTPQSRPFSILVRTQIPTGPLPVEQRVGLVAVEQAAGQVGQLGIGTGNEVQLDSVSGTSLSPINLEDFPADVPAAFQAQNPGLTVRRAYRYAEPAAAAALKASAVEPDVRVDTQDTLSLGEDRTVLAANPTVEITRAGIFKLSFLMPQGFDVESVSGPALSHWTELKSDEGRVITLNLTGKTEGKQQFSISLAGAGVRSTNAWLAPQIAFREATKQTGTLLVVPEQGLRLQVANSEGLTQLDPQKSGIKQKGVLAFRVLQTPRSLSLNLEKVDAWIQITSLQHVTLSEAQTKIAANLQYQIENTGVKTFQAWLPTNAASVQFQGEQMADFLPLAGSVTNGLQLWEAKLHRRVIGTYLLQVKWQTSLPEKATEFLVRGIEAADANLQRGFLTLESGGRLQLRAEAPSAALQPAEWQSIPRGLQQGFSTSAADLTYRVVEPAFALPLSLERHEVASLLPARVNSITFKSVISDEGVMLTQVRLEILPGDKRLLNLTLPPKAEFWFGFVNQKAIWPWRQENRILIPLEKQARGDRAMPVELFYTSKVGAVGSSSLDLDLAAPKFDLPLENITWVVSLSKKWQVTKWSGSLQLQQEQTVPQLTAIDIPAYLKTEETQERDRTRQAEQFLAAANSALQQGDPLQARRDFQAAYGLSTHDAAFNEDARVQLHNIKLQQALIGLNVRQGTGTTDASGSAAKLKELRSRKELNYTQQDAKEIIERNTDDDNAALMRLAERLIQQQDAAAPNPAALRANLPEQDRMITFRRAVAVDPWADLQIGLKASAVTTASWSMRLLILGTVLVLLAILAQAAKWNRAE